MPLFFFHLADSDHTITDDEGTELADLQAARAEAVSVSRDLLRANAVAAPSRGTPWRLWVTDKPNGAGKTLSTLQLSARDC